MTDLLQHVENQIQARHLIKQGDKVLVAVSGGLDSMVLLHALKKLSARHNWKLTVAHFNHQLRGRASDADERLVRKTAAAMKLPFVAESADVKESARKLKLSIEMAARKLRHGFFAHIARRRRIQTVALAHQADDQIELFFLRLLRGAGSKGLAGMKWQSPSPADKKIRLVRPLLDLNKDELQKFARENKIAFRDDATNFSSDFLRNRIRNELLPMLRSHYQPGLNKTILRVMDIVGAESDFVASSASSLQLNLIRPEPEGCNFGNLPVAIQRRILQSQLIELAVVADFDLVEQLRKSSGKHVSVGSGRSVAREENGKLKLRVEQSVGFSSNGLEINLSGGAADATFGDVKLNWSFANDPRQRRPRQSSLEIFDAGKIGGKILLRHWRAGDRFQPIGLKSAAKLQNLFTNAKIPLARRRNLVVAEASGGEIFWVEGLRISENFKLSLQTRRRLIWNWQRVHANEQL